MSEHEEEEEYQANYIQVKAKDAVKLITDTNNQSNKAYYQVCPDNALMIQASVIDNDFMLAVDIWRAKGYDPCISTGKPTNPPPCPPGQQCS